MQCDVRQTTSEGMLKAFEQFKNIEPNVNWYNGRLTLVFKKGNRRFIVSYIRPSEPTTARTEYYPGESNIRFDSYIKFNTTLQNIVNDYISRGESNDILNYI